MSQYPCAPDRFSLGKAGRTAYTRGLYRACDSRGLDASSEIAGAFWLNFLLEMGNETNSGVGLGRSSREPIGPEPRRKPGPMRAGGKPPHLE